MLRRPKSGDSEADLLRDQEQFLASGVPPAVTVVRRADKRRGEPGIGDGESPDTDEIRDVVTIADLPDEIPSLTPTPSKKSRFKANRVRFVDADPEAELDRCDTHVTAVLSKIVERDTSTVPVSIPPFTSAAFPRVFHRSEVEDKGKGPGPGTRGKKSIFAQKIAAQKAKERSLTSYGNSEAHCPSLGAQGSDNLPGVSMMTESPHLGSEVHGGKEMSRLVSGQGLSQQDGSSEAQKIHEENQAKLRSLPQSEVLEMQKTLLTQLDPRLVDFVRSQKSQGPSKVTSAPAQSEQPGDKTASETLDPLEEDMEHDGPDSLPPPPITVQDLPFQPKKEWLHMNKLEPEKLEWMRDQPAPRKRSTRKAMQARFDFDGALIPPTEDLPTHLGLHHHGDEPELAGYSLQELFLLCRSQVVQQRSLALTTLAHIIAKARAGDFACSVRGSVLSTLLDAGLVFLLRFALDDSVEGVMAAAVHALRSLLVSPEDEESLDSTFSWYLGMSAFPLLPFSQEEEDEEDVDLEDTPKETAKKKEEEKPDHDVAQADIVKGLLKMKLLPRLRYILEVVRPPPRTVLHVLEILIRIARHSPASATQVLECPRLMETVMSHFLPCSWTPHDPPTCLHGLPVPAAMKLLRVLAGAGRHACARLLNNLGGRERLSRFVAVEPCELPLAPGEALRIATEALRLWAVATGYGQACDLYRDLYPILVKALQSVPRAWPPTDPLWPLELQRAQALVTLLTHVTHTAGCHQELQAALASSEESECPPPPVVDWSHVTGLQRPLLASLKGCIKTLGDPSQRESSVSLLASLLLYLGTYYSQLHLQNSFRPVECLQELEALASDVLLPLLSHQAVRGLIDRLRSCSALCNPLSCCPSTEAVASLPRFGSSGGRPALSLASSSSPLPFFTALCYLLEAVTRIHKGIVHKFSSLLLSDLMSGYLRACCEASPTLTPSSAWLLRHEHHLLYLLLKLAHRLMPASPEVAKQASLYHQAALSLLPRLLPGSEHMAHDLFSSIIFNSDFMPEGRCGGPEAADLSDLQLKEGCCPSQPPLGPLLRDACAHLPSLRGCYLTHLAYMEPAVLRSRDLHLGRTPYVYSCFLSEASGPALPADWPFLPLVSLYERVGVPGGGDVRVESLPPASLESVTHCLQWLLLLESWRESSLAAVLPAAKLARLSCLFLCSSDLFLERPVQRLTWALLRTLCHPRRVAALDLAVPPPGLASFHDLYSALLSQFEAVSFGDPLFGCFILLPLQRRFSATMRLAVFGEHVGLLRSLGVQLQQLPVPLEAFTSPPEDSLPLLQLYFRSLVTGALRRSWCPVLYVVALVHLNSFIFSQEPVSQEVEAARQSLLRKTYYLTDEVLKNHLLLFKLPSQQDELGFQMYDCLPPTRARRLESVLGMGKGEGAHQGCDSVP
ncbi:RNA polymerase II-associated protein 1 isoform X1 [Paramormyrops kingsleyae]|uniref:RNA polymerase II associated protein 1 n=1 Tax=Paramormyrops kingsleyae TaxID=1676925 RepID=A0A3B3QM07_9TELE|nr:RNA polymerase II-associated protein 1 isoform X1 [Paramormyrops kingsleyae]XP_023684201.1 RNA polymerase II-associated protein 1 isoform X1 [Paramormyrops kingsleyae]